MKIKKLKKQLSPEWRYVIRIIAAVALATLIYPSAPPESHTVLVEIIRILAQ